MAKICVNCDKKIGFFSNDPFEFNNVVLCYDCAKPILNDLNDLYYLKSKKEFYELRNKIINKSNELYSVDVVNSIYKKIELIYNNIKAGLQDDIPEGSVPEIEENSKQKEPSVSAKFTHQEKSSTNDLYIDIGKKIKNLAKWTFIFEAIGAIITGLVLLFTDEGLILYGLLTLICGPIIAYVGSWILYAFGELVDKTSENEKNTRNILALMKKSTKE